MTESSLFDAALVIATAMLLAALALAGWRMMCGPSLADRVVALDMLSLVGIGFGGVAALAVGHAAFLDVALGVALIGFLGTVAFAGFLEAAGRRAAHERDER